MEDHSRRALAQHLKGSPLVVPANFSLDSAEDSLKILPVLDLCQSDKGFEIFLLHYASGVSREAPPGTITTMGFGTAAESTAMRLLLFFIHACVPRRRGRGRVIHRAPDKLEVAPQASGFAFLGLDDPRMQNTTTSQTDNEEETV